MAVSQLTFKLKIIVMNNQSTAWEPGDDICPPWWPFWWRRFIKWPPKPPIGFEKLEQFHLILTIHEFAEQLQDSSLGDEIQKLTHSALRKNLDQLSFVNPPPPGIQVYENVSKFIKSKYPQFRTPMDREAARMHVNTIAQEFLSLAENKHFDVHDVRGAVYSVLRTEEKQANSGT